MDDNELARYLAQYIKDNEEKILSNYDGWIVREELEKLIKDFYNELP